jgi:hypothetical protein
MVRISYCVLFVMLFLPLITMAQDSAKVMQDWYTDAHTTYLNVDIASDTAASPAYKAGNRVYVLKNGGIYYWNRSFNIPFGRTFKIKSDNKTSVSKYDPIIFLYQTGTGTGTQPIQPPGNMFNMTGGTVNMKHIMVSGYDELVDSSLNWVQGGVITVPTGGAGSSIYVDSCVLKTWNGNHIRTDGYAHVVSVTNTLFADMGFLGRSNLGAGKAFDFRDVQIDTALIQNCTFINWQDRIIRHLNAKAPIKNLTFDHNTLINGMSYHGMFDIGKVDSTGTGIMNITNNLLIDPFSLGNDTDVTRQAEFTDAGEKDAFGQGRMTWFAANPNNAVNWNISNNYYAISDSGQKFLSTYPFYKNEGPALTWNMNKRLNVLGKDTTKTFQKITIQPVKVPMLMTKFNRWYYSATGGYKTKQTNNFTQSTTPGVWTYDYDRKSMWWYADSLNCNFKSSINLSAAATDGKVIGDTRWKYLGVSTGVHDVSAIPMKFTLGQNYPNPFNPSTKIEYTIPTASSVTLQIYNLLGQVVATLVDERQEANSYVKEFDASRLSSGIYFYQINAGNFNATKKMILMK